MNREVKAFVLLVLISFFGQPVFLLSEEISFRVGVSSALSGEVATFGTAAKNGIVLTTEENQQLFKNIDFIFRDDRYDAKTAVTIFNQLRTTGDIDLLFSVEVTPSEAIIPLAERYQFPVIANCTILSPLLTRNT